MGELIDLARENRAKYEEWLSSTDTSDIRELVIDWDNEQYTGYSRKELLEMVMEWSAEGTNGRDSFTRAELIRDIREVVEEDLEDIDPD